MEDDPIHVPEVTSWRQWASPRRLSSSDNGAKVSRRALRQADRSARAEWAGQNTHEQANDYEALWGVLGIVLILAVIFIIQAIA